MTIRATFFAAALLAGSAASSAEANLSVCNETKYPFGVALAHNDGAGWVSLGWWNIDAGACASLLEGDLIARYYYLYAIHFGPDGGWTGDRMFCIATGQFSIRGRGTCEARGYAPAGFFEIDTGDVRDYTQRLSD